ncbi:MAG: metallophosphoesterase family protein [Methanomassiliicoccales archaeon]
MKIVHVSDLHVTSPYFVPEWGERVVTELEEIEPEILLISGDLTDNGHPHEHDEAKRYVDRLTAGERVIVPGNHDARNLGYEIFEELYGARFPKLENDEVSIFGIDSTEPDVDSGHVGRENYGVIRDRLDREDKLTIMMLHHHLIPIPGTGRERQIPVDAGDVLKLCQELDLDLVLSGHRHVPWVWRLEGTHFVTAGTTTSRRLKGRSHPSLNLFVLEEGELTLHEMDVSRGEYHRVLNC